MDMASFLDVVPAPAAQFRPRREGDRLYARGAQDMKVSALAQAMAFRELAGRVPYPLGLKLVTDEEVGGRDGTLHQLRSEVARLRAAARRQGYSGESLRKHGTGDVRFYSSYGTTCVAFGIGGDGQHGPAEYADVTTIAPYYEALTQFLLAPAGDPP